MYTQAPIRGDEYPLSMWWQISNVITSARDLYSFSQVNKTIWSLLAYRRAVVETQLYRESLSHIYQLDRHPERHPERSCVESAIRRRQPLDVIDSVIRGCYSVSFFYLEGPEPEFRSFPVLFVAAEMNRVDVIKVLLKYGYPLDLRYHVRPGCLRIGHFECQKLENTENTCINALCVAREARSQEAEAFLLEQGIEDRCGAHCSPRHYVEEQQKG